MISKHLSTALKGYAMGAANIVPGISGGTIALLTGIYEELITALNMLMVPSSYRKLLHGEVREFWAEIHGSFLFALLLGVGVSLVSLAKFMEYAIVYHPVQTWAFFFGLIIASSAYIFAGIKNWGVKDVVFTILGGVLGVLICTLSPTQTPDSMWFIGICGAIAICTMILPGISGSFILVILGKYETVIDAVNTLNWPVLAAFAVGSIIGILAFAKFLHWLLAHYERPTMLILLGFVLGSLVKVWPWNDMGAVAKAELLSKGFNVEAADSALGELAQQGLSMTGQVDLHIPGAIIWALVGIVVVCLLEFFSSRSK